MPALSSLRTRKVAAPGAQTAAPTPQPADSKSSRRTSLRSVPPLAGPSQTSSLASTTRPRPSPPSSAVPSSSLRPNRDDKVPSSAAPRIMRITNRTSPSQNITQQTSSDDRPQGPEASAAPTRSGIPTSTGSSRPGSAASSLQFSRPASRPDSSISAKLASPTRPSPTSSSDPPATDPPQPSVLSSLAQPSATDLPSSEVSSSSPPKLAPNTGPATDRLRRSLSGATEGEPRAAPRKSSPLTRSSLGESRSNAAIVVVQKTKSSMGMQKEDSPRVAFPLSSRNTTTSAPSHPPTASSTIRTHRKSLSTTASPAVASPAGRMVPSSSSVVRPRPRPTSLMGTPIGHDPRLTPSIRKPPSAANTLQNPKSTGLLQTLSQKATASGQETPVRKGVGEKLSARKAGVDVTVTSSREDSIAGLPPRASLSYLSPLPAPDTLSPPRAHRYLPKSPLHRLSTATSSSSGAGGRLVPRSSLVSFEAMSRALPQGTLLGETDEFGVALGGVVSPPASFGLRSSRKRREATTSSEGTNYGEGPPEEADPLPVLFFRSIASPPSSNSSTAQTHSLIPLPVGPPPTPQQSDISLAALQSRLHQSLLAQASLQRQLDLATDQTATSSSSPLHPDASSLLNLPSTEFLERDLRAAQDQLVQFEASEDDRQAEMRTMEELLQTSLDDLATSTGQLSTLSGEFASLQVVHSLTVDQLSSVSSSLVKSDELQARLMSEGRSDVGRQWEDVVRRAREELETCRGERETLGFVERMAGRLVGVAL